MKTYIVKFYFNRKPHILNYNEEIINAADTATRDVKVLARKRELGAYVAQIYTEKGTPIKSL